MDENKNAPKHERKTLWQFIKFLLVSGIAGILQIILVNLLCWALGEKKPGWLTAALVLFSLDTVGLLVITFTLLEDPILNLVDIIFHALAVYELVMAVICAGKLKRQAAAETYSATPEIY